MARIEALSMLDTSDGKAYLSEKYGEVIENISKTTISARLKNVELSGDPDSGSVVAKRYANTESKTYGTARSGGKGQASKELEVPVAINTDKELINEVETKDVALCGVDGFIDRKKVSNQDSMARELERAFFNVAATEGSTVTLNSTTINKKVDELIRLVETTKNDFVDGVDRNKIHVILDTDTYGELRDYIDTIPNANVNSDIEEMGRFHGVYVYSSVYLPADVSMIAMAKGSVAQPVKTWLDEAGKFPASNAYHFGMFYSYGTKAVAPDLIQVYKTEA